MLQRHDQTSISLPMRSVSDGMLVTASEERLQTTLLVVNITGFLSGYYVMYNHWIQLAWFGLTLAAWTWVGSASQLMQGLKRDRWLATVAVITVLFMVRSSVLDSPDMQIGDLWLGWLGGGVLLLFLLMLWQCGWRVPNVIRLVGLPMVCSACFSAIGSMLIFYYFHPEGVFGKRLTNWFVYGGLNSVCSGLMFGFAATWAAVTWSTSKDIKERRMWQLLQMPLLAGSFLTLSRGAMLALIAGHVTLFIVQGWRRAWKPCLVLFLAVGAFQMVAPLLSEMAVEDMSHRLKTSDRAEVTRLLGDGVVYSNPMHAMVERADSNRFAIYSAAFKSMDKWQDWTWGKGLWMSNDSWSCALFWYPEHLHSIFMSSLVHGGVPGFAALLLILSWGSWRAFKLARRGEPLWITLAAFGLGGMLFDGQSLFSMLTLPRFEPLLLWVPLVLASARLQMLDLKSARGSSFSSDDEESDFDGQPGS